MSRHRRSLLRAIGTTDLAAGLAGCSGASSNTTSASDGTGTRTDRDETTPQRTSTDPGTDADETGSATDEESGYNPDGGPNVVDSVPERADHVVGMTAVAFEPGTLTVTAGDTVAFENAEGGTHTVTARTDAIPTDADYWASGDFETQADAKSGFDDYDGVVTDGRVYVRTFDTSGTHEYYCIPHSHLEMEGTIVVESK